MRWKYDGLVGLNWSFVKILVGSSGRMCDDSDMRRFHLSWLGVGEMASVLSEIHRSILEFCEHGVWP